MMVALAAEGWFCLGWDCSFQFAVLWAFQSTHSRCKFFDKKSFAAKSNVTAYLRRYLTVTR